MACINPNNPTFQKLAKSLGNYMLAEIEFSKLQNEDFVIQQNGTFLNISEDTKKELFVNYVNLMDRKREGKSISYPKFNQMFNNLQVFKFKNTYIFGEWDMQNNVFKGRLMSSPGIKELYGALDVLLANTDFVASVPGDIGAMLAKKGMYKLEVGKEYNFRGEDMVKNLYFSNEQLVNKVFKTDSDKVTIEQVKKYYEFFKYHSLINKFVNNYLEYTLKFKQNENLKSDVTTPFVKEIKKSLSAKTVNNDTLNYIKAVLFNISNFSKENPEYYAKAGIFKEIVAEVVKIEADIKNKPKGEKFEYEKNEKLIEKLTEDIKKPLTINKAKKLDIGKYDFYNALKDLGLYDYNAFKLAKKINIGRITDAESESILKEIIKNSSINKVNIDKTDLINNPKIYNQLNSDLNKTLATYLSKFGIKTEIIEDIQNKLGIDSLAHVDILNKMLYVDKNNQENYPQQAGKLIAFMMQHNPLITEITSKMKRMSLFKGLTQDQLLEATGDLISQELYKKTNTTIPKDLAEAIRALIQQFFYFLNNIKLARINKNVAFIADNILLQNQSLITQSTFKPGAVGRPVSKIGLEEALKSDKFGNDIVEKMSEYFILTGSITLSEQGTVYRPNDNQMHDIDWVSSMKRDDGFKIFEELYPNNKYIRNITNNDYQTDTWLIAPEGYTIENFKIDNFNGRSKIKNYDIVDSKGEIVSSYVSETDSHTGKIEAKLIDIFSYNQVTEKKTANKEITLESGTKLKIADWRNTFAAKLEFGRLKDIWDYNRFIPDENIYKNSNVLTPTSKLRNEEIFYTVPGLYQEGSVEEYSEYRSISQTKESVGSDLDVKDFKSYLEKKDLDSKFDFNINCI